MPLSDADEALREVILGMHLSDAEHQILDTKFGSPSLGLSTRSQIPHVFMTVNLDREKEPRDLYELVHTLTPRIPCLMGALACLEFVPHSHMHCLFTTPEKFRKSNFIRSIQRALQLDRPELVDIITSKKPQDFANRQKYIRGEKSTSLKLDRCAQDSQIRDAHEIPHFFEL